jgi:hypothetical protein
MWRRLRETARLACRTAKQRTGYLAVGTWCRSFRIPLSRLRAHQAGFARRGVCYGHYLDCSDCCRCARCRHFGCSNPASPHKGEVAQYHNEWVGGVAKQQEISPACLILYVVQGIVTLTTRGFLSHDRSREIWNVFSRESYAGILRSRAIRARSAGGWRLEEKGLG